MSRFNSKDKVTKITLVISVQWKLATKADQALKKANQLKKRMVVQQTSTETQNRKAF
jgi:hypothetical protein